MKRKRQVVYRIDCPNNTNRYYVVNPNPEGPARIYLTDEQYQADYAGCLVLDDYNNWNWMMASMPVPSGSWDPLSKKAPAAAGHNGEGSE